MTPFLLLAFLEPYLEHIGIHIPFFAIQQCCECHQDEYQTILAESMMWYLFTEGTYNMVFFACLYMLRGIED